MGVSNETEYKSSRFFNAIFSIFMAFFSVVCVTFVVSIIFSDNKMPTKIVVLCILFASVSIIFVLVTAFWYPWKYVIHDDHLYYETFFAKIHVKYEDIRKIYGVRGVIPFLLKTTGKNGPKTLYIFYRGPFFFVPIAVPSIKEQTKLNDIFFTALTVFRKK